MVVGYEKTETLTSQQKVIAGVISGITTRFLTQPLDIVKIRTQLQSKQKPKVPLSFLQRSWLGLSWRILREEGLTAFWHGHSLGQIHSILSVSSQFYVYDLSTKLVEVYVTSPQIKQFLLFMCGIFAGCTSAALVSPLEVIRVRQMLVKAQYNGIWPGAKMVYRSGGFKAFYEGLPASLMQMGPQVGITFAVFRFAQPLCLRHLATAQRCTGEDCDPDPAVTKKDLLISSTVAASMAGFVSKSMTYPFDLAKRRLQISSHKPSRDVKAPTTSQNLVKCNTLITCLMDMIRKEGVSGLFSGWCITTVKTQVYNVTAFTTYEMDGFTGLFTGWTITIYKAQLTSVIVFTTYEMICQMLREIDIAKTGQPK